MLFTLGIQKNTELVNHICGPRDSREECSYPKIKLKCPRSLIKYWLGNKVALLPAQELAPGTGNCLALHCLALLSSRGGLAEGGLVVLGLVTTIQAAPAAREKRRCFGLVTGARRVEEGSLGEEDRERVRQLRGRGMTGCGRLTSLTLTVRAGLVPAGRLLARDKPLSLQPVARLRHELRKFEALLDLPRSRLCGAVVDGAATGPPPGPASQHLHARLASLPALGRLNPAQRGVVVGAARAVRGDPAVPRVCLVQGPPGTGKSTTLAALILQVLYSGPGSVRPRVLAVAPSNTAVDQLAAKLLALQAELPGQDRFSMLRLGRAEAIAAEVREATLEVAVKRRVEATARERRAAPSLELDLRDKRAAAGRLGLEQTRATEAGQQDLAAKLGRDRAELQTQLALLQRELDRGLARPTSRQLERQAEQEILAGADVLLTTLSRWLAQTVSCTIIPY